MDAKAFVKLNGLFVFKHALAQFRFKPKMFLVVYQDEYDFAHEIKPNHGNCVFSYDDVKRYVDAYELVQLFKGIDRAKMELEACGLNGFEQILIKLDVGVGYVRKHRLMEAIQLVEGVK